MALERLSEEYPNAQCALVHRTPFELLAATILSAQCTDQRVNMVTPALFAKYPTAEALAVADPSDVEQIIHSTGFFRAKARSLIGMAHAVATRFGGEIPSDLQDLVTLPGVGRKTGNVLRSVALGLPGLPVDTHVGRISRLLKLTAQVDPVKVEHELGAMIPVDEWGRFSLLLIEHGRAVCKARKPLCAKCCLVGECPSASP